MVGRIQGIWGGELGAGELERHAIGDAGNEPGCNHQRQALLPSQRQALLPSASALCALRGLEFRVLVLASPGMARGGSVAAMIDAESGPADSPEPIPAILTGVSDSNE